MVPSPPSNESFPGVAAEVERLNLALAVGSTPSFASDTRKMLTRKPTKTPSSRPAGETFRVDRTRGSDALAPAPSKAPSARSLALQKEIEATTPAREAVRRSVRGEETTTRDEDARRDVGAPRASTPETERRVSFDSPLALVAAETDDHARATGVSSMPSRVRACETAAWHAALAAVEAKLGDVERDPRRAEREAADAARRAASSERTDAAPRRDRGEDARACASTRLVVDDADAPSDPKREGRRVAPPSSAASARDAESLSAEPREAKRSLREASARAASASADAENEKVVDETLPAANDVTDDLERERAGSQRAEGELAKAGASARARDESRLREIVEVESALALDEASLRVEKERASKRDGSGLGRDASSASVTDADRADEATREWHRERERLRRELGEARSAAAAAEARASRARSSAAGARTAAALAEAATQAVEARRDSIETKLREDLRETRQKLRRVAERGEEGAGTAFLKPTGRTKKPPAARRAAARVLALCLLVLALAGGWFLSLAFLRRPRGRERACAARWIQGTSVVDEALSRTLGAPFRRDDGRCDVPPAT